MSTSHYCDECGDEILLIGNQFHDVVYGRNPGREDGWHVYFRVYREYNGNTGDDLCRKCVQKIVTNSISFMNEKAGGQR
jgi:hypothetical protein